jgi:hypothetical protein
VDDYLNGPGTASRQLGRVMDLPMSVFKLSKGTSMQIVLGPVLTRNGGYAFDCWTPEEGLSRGYIYRRIEDAHYARNVEIRSRNRASSDQTIACGTLDDFVRLTLDLRGRQQTAWAMPLTNAEEKRVEAVCG